LLGLNDRGVSLCIVVVDNDGGGIFSFLPQAAALDDGQFELLFGTPHGVDLSLLANAHGLPVLKAFDDESVGAAVTAALAAGGVHVVIATSSRSQNVDVHDQLQRAGAEAARLAGWSTA
jgi:2-succinyl-5-enolpyruvyl-6-hydroxy-3-cyclohexene-1-carboxylate synthase